jgi:cytochrome c oxidase subunit 3
MTMASALPRDDQLRLGLWSFLATVTMLFAAFTSAFVVRRGGTDWQAVSLPAILWTNTASLGASSMALEIANRWGLRNRWRLSVGACGAALVLGLAFLFGQLAAWRELVAGGVYLSSNPFSSFFYVMTGAHAVHVVAALIVLAWGTVVTWFGERNPQAWATQMELCRTFWHYLGGVWLFVFVLIANG